MEEYSKETNEWLVTRLETLKTRYYESVKDVADVMNKFYSIRKEIGDLVDEMKVRGIVEVGLKEDNV